ncbi:m7GpppX diphosphatase-like isoform X2 [Nelusetta ayraudi]|uniref:m7GpppX diphosphatase-like isoform X2 n=1 Tax=Nelusetta ayraudi TaxID=303726 RepID=UPI003F7111CA
MDDTAAKREGHSLQHDESVQEVKRVKSDDRGAVEKSSEAPEAENILSAVTATKVLKDSAREKSIFIHGKLGDQEAVVIMESTPITEDTLGELFAKSKLRLESEGKVGTIYRLQAPPHLNAIKTTVVCPATDNHVKKYQRQETFLVEETDADYRSITLPYIEKHCLSVQWVCNILEKKAEVERIVYEDPDPDVGFILLPDFKWDQRQVDDLYLIAIVNQRNIRSLRDLRSTHLPLLKNIYKKGQEAILQRYQLPTCQLRIYLHYQPSYYHLHIHFTKLSYEVPGCSGERAHLLADVIQNLHLNSDYYKSQTMYFPLRADHGLMNKFKKAGRL